MNTRLMITLAVAVFASPVMAEDTSMPQPTGVPGGDQEEEGEYRTMNVYAMIEANGGRNPFQREDGVPVCPSDERTMGIPHDELPPFINITEPESNLSECLMAGLMPELSLSGLFGNLDFDLSMCNPIRDRLEDSTGIYSAASDLDDAMDIGSHLPDISGRMSIGELIRGPVEEGTAPSGASGSIDTEEFRAFYDDWAREMSSGEGETPSGEESE